MKIIYVKSNEVQNNLLSDNFDIERTRKDKQTENAEKNSNVIIVVTVFFPVGNAEFLKYLLSSFMIEPSKINAQCNGDTVLHVLVKDLDTRKTTIGETIIGLLVNHGCRLDIKDNVGKTPVEYTSKGDQIFRLIQNAANCSTGKDIFASDIFLSTPPTLPLKMVLFKLTKRTK